MLEQGIEKAKQRLKLVMNQVMTPLKNIERHLDYKEAYFFHDKVQSFLDLRNIISAGPFLYAIIQDGTPDSKVFSRPNTLSLLAHFTLRAHLVSLNFSLWSIKVEFPCIFSQ